MARWKLTAKHYLSVPGVKYEKNETSSTGRSSRQTFEVPTYLDPDDESQWTHMPDAREAGIIVVAQGTVTDVRDIVFVSNPTPDMVPLDDEAREITESMGWDSRRIIQGADFGDGLVDAFIKAQAEVQSKQSAGVGKLEEQMAAMAAAITMLAERGAPHEGLRRV